MKHGLKQEIKRGLSVLMAVSMVASSALPVMAEEVVEEAVEVETVSEEVADEAEDVVVDVAEDAEVVEEVVDGEVVAEEPADLGEAQCQHTDIIRTVSFDTSATLSNGSAKNIYVIEQCVNNDKTEKISIIEDGAFNSSQVDILGTSTPPASSFSSDNKYGIYWYTPIAPDCKTPVTWTYTVFYRSGDTVTRLGSQDYTVSTSHSYSGQTPSVKTVATCDKNGSIEVECSVCKKTQVIEYKDIASTTGLSVPTDIMTKITAAGHKYKPSVKDLTWGTDYSTATLTMTCANDNCSESVTVNLTDAIEVYKLDANGNHVGSAYTVNNFPKQADCGEDLNLEYTFTTAANASGILALVKEAERQAGKEYDHDSVVDGGLNGAKGVITLAAMSAPTVKNPELQSAISFKVTGWNTEKELPIVTATIAKCGVCGKTDHSFSSDVDYTKGAYKKSFAVAVNVKKVTETKVTCADLAANSAAKDTTTYSVEFVLGSNTYSATNYSLTVNSPAPEGISVVNKQVVYSVAPSTTRHSFSEACTNENAIKDNFFVAATCTKEGIGHFTCTTCGLENAVGYIPTLPHKYVNKEITKTKVATHTADATYEAYCSVCNKKYDINNTLDYAVFNDGSDLTQDTYLSRANALLAAGYKDLADAYYKLQREAVTELTAKDTKGHNYKYDEKTAPTVWAKDYSTATVTFKCGTSDASTYDTSASTSIASGKTVTGHNLVVKVTAKTEEVVTKEPGFDTKGSKYFVATATFTDEVGKVWTQEVKSAEVEIPATGEQETATVSLTGKTVVTYNGDRQHLTATTNSDVKPVVSYYKDAALTKKFSGAPYTAGTYYVKATVAESKKYTAAESEVVKLVIKKATPKVTISWKADKQDATKANITVKQKNIGGQQGKVTYTAKNAKIEVNSKGVVTFTDKAKKGTNYKVVIKVKATTNYNGYTRTIKVKF